MSVTVTLSAVSTCEASSCTYNTNRRCRAPAITIGSTIGGKVHLPVCVTSLPDDEHFIPFPLAGVGACRVLACAHNCERNCHAGAIEVALIGEEPTCAMFKPIAP
jgi:ferredoxin